MLYEVWSEGYSCTGQQAGAKFHGEVDAPSFKKACNKLFGDNSYYDKKNMDYWGCQLFDNENDARRSFG